MFSAKSSVGNSTQQTAQASSTNKYYREKQGVDVLTDEEKLKECLGQ